MPGAPEETAVSGNTTLSQNALLSWIADVAAAECELQLYRKSHPVRSDLNNLNVIRLIDQPLQFSAVVHYDTTD